MQLLPKHTNQRVAAGGEQVRRCPQVSAASPEQEQLLESKSTETCVWRTARPWTGLGLDSSSDRKWRILVPVSHRWVLVWSIWSQTPSRSSRSSVKIRLSTQEKVGGHLQISAELHPLIPVLPLKEVSSPAAVQIIITSSRWQEVNPRESIGGLGSFLGSCSRLIAGSRVVACVEVVTFTGSLGKCWGSASWQEKKQWRRGKN